MDQLIAEIGSPTFSKLATLIAAIGALGAAAAGFVDASKFFSGGISNAGFKFVNDALAPFDTALVRALGSGVMWQNVFKAHWLNGGAKEEQKAIAKSLIRLGLDAGNAAALAGAAGVSSTILGEAATALQSGTDLTPSQLNVLGRFDTAVEARLDAAFERADQFYRNASKLASGIVAIILAVVAGGVLYLDGTAAGAPTAIWGYIFSKYCVLAAIAGAAAVPLAPVSKDLISALGTAVKAMKATKG